MVITDRIRVKTLGNGDGLEVTSQVSKHVQESGIKSGIVTIFVPGSTGGLTTIEFEPGAVNDFKGAMNRIAPPGLDYQHHLRWGDDNGHSHVQAALLGPSLTVPFVNGMLTLGQWQQIMFVDFDTRPRSRELITQIIGE